MHEGPTFGSNLTLSREREGQNGNEERGKGEKGREEDLRYYECFIARLHDYAQRDTEGRL